MLPEQGNTNLWCFSYTMLTDQTRVLAYVYLQKSRRKGDGISAKISQLKRHFSRRIMRMERELTIGQRTNPTSRLEMVRPE